MFLVSLRCGQPVTLASVAVDHAARIMIDRAQIFFERAKALDPDNIVVDSLVTMVRMFIPPVICTHPTMTGTMPQPDTFACRSSRIRR